MQQPTDPGAQGPPGDQRPGSKFIGIRGPEPQSSLMICARESLSSGIRLLLFHRILDGTYRPKSGQKSKVKGAVSRIMIASVKMRYFRIRGGGADGDEDEECDEIKIANAHLNFRTAKRDLQGGAIAYKRFWDLLAQYMATWRPTVLCGDFNMALFAVVPELRARGFEINLAAWYCWQNDYEEHVRADSCGIFRIGPCQGIRMCFDASVFGLQSANLPANCSMVMEIVRDDEGKEIGKRPFAVPRLGFLGQVHPLVCYRPTVPARREKFVQWTFTPAFDALSPAVAGIMESARSDKAMFPFKVDTTMGSTSWSWPECPPSKQKLASFEHFDPQRQFFKRGAHMPLMIYIGAPSEVRRSKAAQRRRAVNATRRGWTWERRQATQVSDETRDRGGGAKGTHKGRGRYDVYREPSDIQSKGGKGGARGGGQSRSSWQ